MQYADIPVMSLVEYIAQQRAHPLFGEDGTPRYAHPMDEWILRALNAAPIKSMLDRSIDALLSMLYGQELASGIFIDQRSFPDLYQTLSSCAETLGIPVPHALVVTSPWLFNAATAGTEEYSFILITDGLSQFFTSEEASFVIGHECGHIAAKHMVYHTLVAVLAMLGSRALGPLGRMIADTIGLPLQAWSRRSEVTADRAGLLCCGDIGVAERALLRLVAGHASIDRVDVDDYLRRYQEMGEFHSSSSWQQLFYSHPLIPKRIEALRLFARSELFFELSGRPVPPGTAMLTRPELDRRVADLVKP